MPTYTYACTQCENVSEARQSIHDVPLSDCTSCGTNGTLERRILSTAGGHRIGGVLNSTSMYNVSGDPGPRRKNYDCDPMN